MLIINNWCWTFCWPDYSFCLVLGPIINQSPHREWTMLKRVYGQRCYRSWYHEGCMHGTQFLFHKKSGYSGVFFFTRHTHTYTRALFTQIHKRTHNTHRHTYLHNGRRFWMGARGLFRAPSPPRLRQGLGQTGGKLVIIHMNCSCSVWIFYIELIPWVHAFTWLIDRVLFHLSLRSEIPIC